MDAQGKGVPCCTWELDSWMGPFMAFNSVTLLWTLFLVGQVRVFVTAGTIAQWYFAPQVIPRSVCDAFHSQDDNIQLDICARLCHRGHHRPVVLCPPGDTSFCL